MSAATTLDRLVRVLNDSLPDGLGDLAVTDDTPLDAVGVDSLILIDLIFDLEEEFGVKLKPEELLGMTRVGDLTAHLERHAPPG